MPDGPDELAELERRREELYRELGHVGDFRRGSLTEVGRKFGKPNCACAAPDHPGHGPQWNLTRTIEGRTRATGDKSFDTALGLVTVTRAWYHCAESGRAVGSRW